MASWDHPLGAININKGVKLDIILDRRLRNWLVAVRTAAVSTEPVIFREGLKY